MMFEILLATKLHLDTGVGKILIRKYGQIMSYYICLRSVSLGNNLYFTFFSADFAALQIAN